MAKIEVSEMCPRVRLDGEQTRMGLCVMRNHLESESKVELYVDGWSEPWECFLDDFGKMRARCPTSPKVVPEVEQVATVTLSD